MVRDLTGMEIANASLLDEATAAAEAMTMLARVQAKRIDGAGGSPQFLVADSCYAQTLDVVRGRAIPLGIDVVVVPNGGAEHGGVWRAVSSARWCRPRTKRGGFTTCAGSSRGRSRRACLSPSVQIF
jgi:glycine cleavage system pyridoxal-binding protein P